jgi:hypothetical protein
MRAPILSAVAATVALFALPAAAHGWTEDRDDSTVEVRECPLPAPAYHHHASHVYRHRAHAVRCQVAEAAPVDERVVRVYHHEDRDEWRGDRDRDEGARDRDRDWRGADNDRDMYEDHGMSMRHEEHEDRDMGRDEGERRMMDDRGRAYVGGAVHHEDEDRRGWDDHEYARRDGGMHWDSGEARWRVYRMERERSFEHGEHWLGDCGCGPARPSATDEDGYLVWAGKVGPDDSSWVVHP